jgi:hypothetical protein
MLDSLGALDGPAMATARAGESLLSGATATGGTDAAGSRRRQTPNQLRPLGRLARVASTALRRKKRHRCRAITTATAHSHHSPVLHRHPPPGT